MSMDENGNYSTSLGLETLAKYATMFGLDHTSGVEIDEASPKISDTDPERSSMGQGSHAFTNTQLARYVTAMANRGTVFELSLIGQVDRFRRKSDLKTIRQPYLLLLIFSLSHPGAAVQAGMEQQVIAEGSAKSIFSDLAIEVAGKTGTAQEDTRRTNNVILSFPLRLMQLRK